jgi:DNA invertase Pin-like site-specific DNA recombinase
MAFRVLSESRGAIKFTLSVVEENLMVAKGKRFVSYLRVSTTRQGADGLGVAAQREAVERHVAGDGGRIVAEFVEVESGRKNDRPQLAAAIEACRRYNAVLAISRLDRLARNAAFLLSLRDAGIEFVAADMPSANRMTVGVMALVAEQEAEAISARTRAALAAARARGVKLGGSREGAYDISVHGRDGHAAGLKVRQGKAMERAANLASAVQQLRAEGAVSLAQLANGLNLLDIPAPRGGRWAPAQVMYLLKNLEKVAA